MDDACSSGLLAGDPDARRELDELLAIDAGDSFEVEVPHRGKTPRAIGPYELMRELGSGGMGTVYLAQQRVPIERLVAIKLMTARITTSSLTSRFDIERRACARMHHAGIAKLFDAGTTTDDRPYYVMEYVVGKPLLEHCSDTDADLDVRLRLFMEICRAVHHAHQKGVLHRDLKPANILVDTQAEQPTPKIIDFGIAKWMHDSDTSAGTPTIGGELVGTPEYMSPEQAGGLPLDTRSDVYSLGVVLFELVTGRRPFECRTSRLDVLRAIEEQPPPRASRLASTERDARRLRGDIDSILEKALAKEPERRYQSCSEFASDIGRFLAGEPVEACPPSRWYRFRKLLRRNRGAAVGMAIGLVALSSGTTIAIWQARRAHHHLTEYRRMTDVKRARDLLARARDDLWPASPSIVRDLAQWLDEARALIRRRPDHKARIDELERALRGSPTESERTDLGWQLETLEGLILDTERLQRGDLRGPTIASVEARLESATNMVATTIDAHRAAWELARATIADERLCPLYHGFELPEQPGLVPLGRNDTTTLYEFWHVGSGIAPVWSLDGSIRIERDTGVVLVLVPGGEFHMGAVTNRRDGEHNVDPFSGHVSRPVHLVRLDPFFLSRFEMTQGQWERWTSNNPSRLQPPASVRGKVTTWTNPVERITWTQTSRVLRQIGLALPTEAQWEYACRAGTETIFECGNDLESVRNVQNLADAASRSNIGGAWAPDPDTDDGYALHASVGSFAPNRWGFFDMHGNVAEWCADAFLAYDIPVRSGDGLRASESDADSRVARGGSFYFAAVNARSAERHRYAPETVSGFVGVRPALAVRSPR
ncbi:MAG: SUMF1/EgtB/PvdO family nonheme iron enzyme [Planctomycetes bacterium]|nr:SUMF1/EgtB/PvdO family nonheme iron enzyme [Planctomycetota bacterium]